MAQHRLVVDTVTVPMADGVGLATDVVRPNTDRPCSTLLTRTPYGRQHSRIADDVIGLARAGWAVVVQDVRGRGESEGEFEPFVQEVADGAGAVSWIEAQPWSDGRVAMFGGSYRGATQWLAARSRPRALRAIAPMVATASYGEGWTFEGGVPTGAFVRNWALRFASSGSGPLPEEAERALALVETPPEQWAADDDALVARLFPPYRSWIDPTDDAYWSRVDGSPADHVGDVAAFQVVGWYDMFCEGGLRAFEAAAAGPHPQRLIVGPWSHGVWPGPVVGDLNLGALADPDRAGVRSDQFAWMRAALDDHERESLGVTVRVFQLGANRWLDLPSWPPPSSPMNVVLTPSGGLAASAPSGPDRVIAHDPADPAPSIGGRQPAFWPRPGPVDLTDLEARPDIATFTSDVVEQPIDVAGTVRARLRVRAARGAQVVLRLCDVHPDGRTYTIVEHGHALPAGCTEAEPLDLAVGSTAWRVAPGHRIRLHLACASWPRLKSATERFELALSFAAPDANVISFPTGT